VIVGPNGCGKSNLLDAMRWVLGEQSVKLLRGTTQEEIIFAGSNDRKPTSMAEAELTIDNSSGKIKMDFSEISIKRKLYRSGESEYFINKEQVRLKDIQNLFLDTGLGKGSYSIIGQGQVEQVLTSKPIDRRSIFEEAAGINQYKSRKVATLRKLEQTHQNLLRLQDLRSEIHGLLGPLEIQAGKAQEYNDLKTQLSEMEIGLYKEQIEKGRARGVELETKINEIKGQLEKLRSENVNIDQKRDEYKAQIKSLEERIEAYRQESSQTRGKMELAQSEIKVSQEREAAQKERLEQIAIEKENIQKNIETLEATLVSSGEDQKASEMALNEMEVSFTQKDEETRTHFEKWQSLSDDIEKLRKLLLGIDDELTRERHMQVDLKSQEKYFQEDLLTLKNRLQKSEENQIETDSRLKEAQNKKQELISKQSQLARNREVLFSTRSQKEEMRRKLLEQKQLLKQSFDSKSARLSLLKEMQSNYEGFDRGVKAMLIAKKDQPNEFGAILGVMADLIDSPKE
jgi:chromosome segregation protein